jgi:hypothetical protein
VEDDKDGGVPAPAEDQPVSIPDREPEPEAAEPEPSEDAPEVEAEPEGEGAETDDGDGDEPAEDPQPKRKRPGKYQRTVSRLEAELEQVKALLHRQATQAPQRAPEAEPEPKQEDFTDYTAYLDARTEWKTRATTQQIIQQERQKFATAQTTRAERAAASAYFAKVDTAKAKYDDFEDVAFADDVPITDPMTKAIMGAENGPEIQYYLGSHIEEARAISRQDPYSQVRAIGRLEAKLLTPSPKKTTTAPKPVKPLGGTGAGGVGQTDPAKMDMDQYVAWRQKGGG